MSYFPLQRVFPASHYLQANETCRKSGNRVVNLTLKALKQMVNKLRHMDKTRYLLLGNNNLYLYVHPYQLYTTWQHYLYVTLLENQPPYIQTNTAFPPLPTFL